MAKIIYFNLVLMLIQLKLLTKSGKFSSKIFEIYGAHTTKYVHIRIWNDVFTKNNPKTYKFSYLRMLVGLHTKYPCSLKSKSIEDFSKPVNKF